MKLICSAQGAPRKVIFVADEALEQSSGPLDNMHLAMETRYNPYRSPRIAKKQLFVTPILFFKKKP